MTDLFQWIKSKGTVQGLLLTFYCYFSLTSVPVLAADTGVYAPFADEVAAMERYSSEPSEANRLALATVRFQHAVDMFQSLNRKEAGARDMFARALSYAESAALLAPNRAAYWQLYGIIASDPAEISQLQEIAVVALQTARDLDPKSPATLVFLARAYQRLGQYDHATAELQTLLVNNPAATESIDFVRTWTTCYILSGSPLDGADALLGALATRPGLVAAATARRLLLGTAYKAGLTDRDEVLAADNDLKAALNSGGRIPDSLRDFAQATLDVKGAKS
jgi:tetratricopeptide (TPR) repeat protein